MITQVVTSGTRALIPPASGNAVPSFNPQRRRIAGVYREALTPTQAAERIKSYNNSKELDVYLGAVVIGAGISLILAGGPIGVALGIALLLIGIIWTAVSLDHLYRSNEEKLQSLGIKIKHRILFIDKPITKKAESELQDISEISSEDINDYAKYLQRDFQKGDVTLNCGSNKLAKLALITHSAWLIKYKNKDLDEALEITIKSHAPLKKIAEENQEIRYKLQDFAFSDFV